MTKLLIGALALSLVGGTLATAQPDNHDRQMSGDRHDRMSGDRHDRGRMRTVCVWRHHHRVCHRQHW